MKGEDDEIGRFETSVNQYLGHISMYYDQYFQDKPFGNWFIMRYFVQNCSSANGNFITENITLDNQNITGFNITPISSNDSEFRIDALSDNNIVRSENIRIGIDFDYENKSWQKITLVEDGDFTTIMRAIYPIVTVRTENILRKVEQIPFPKEGN